MNIEVCKKCGRTMRLFYINKLLFISCYNDDDFYRYSCCLNKNHMFYLPNDLELKLKKESKIIISNDNSCKRLIRNIKHINCPYSFEQEVADEFEDM